MITYPWKADPKLLPDNRSQGIKKLEATERRQPAKTGDGENEIFKEAVREGTS